MGIEELAYKLGAFIAVLHRITDNKDVLDWLEERDYTALDLNNLQVQLYKLAKVFYKDR